MCVLDPCSHGAVSVWLSQQLLLQEQLRIFLTRRHIYSHEVSVALSPSRVSTYGGHTLLLTQLTLPAAAATVLKFNTDCVTLVVNARHRSGLVPC